MSTGRRFRSGRGTRAIKGKYYTLFCAMSFPSEESLTREIAAARRQYHLVQVQRRRVVKGGSVMRAWIYVFEQRRPHLQRDLLAPPPTGEALRHPDPASHLGEITPTQGGSCGFWHPHRRPAPRSRPGAPPSPLRR